MKAHMRIKLRQPVGNVGISHWTDVIANPTLAQSTLHPHVDRTLNRHNLPFIATLEYQPRTANWSRPELRAGLDRVYRVILRNSTRIPPEVVEEISVIPVVEQVSGGAIGQVELPETRAVSMSTNTDEASRHAIGLDKVRGYTQGDKDITVAVLDTGVSVTHPEFREVITEGFDAVNIIDGATEFFGDFLDADSDPNDEVGHGTHVAGIIGAKGHRMPKGVVPRCRIMPVRVLAAMVKDGKKVGAGLVENINFGVKWAIDHGADVINMSLGIRRTGGGLPHDEVIRYAREEGVTIVAATGNDGSDQYYYPGALPGVIAVGAIGVDGDIADFSTFGRHVSLVAPGVQIYSSYLDHDYAFSTGTSHASPFVAGAVALLKSFALKRGKSLADHQIKHILKHTSDKLDTRFKHPKAGFGRLNLSDALRLADSRLR